MFSAIFSKSKSTDIPSTLFGQVAEQSRSSKLYGSIGVPDTVMGRFDMLAMHTYLLTRRLRGEKEERAKDLAQEVFDCFVRDVERALRELGIGDTTVPKRIKRMVRSFYGQIEDFDTALDNRDLENLQSKVESRYGDGVDGFQTLAMAEYMLAADRHLASQEYGEILVGNIDWIEVSATIEVG